MTFQFTPTDKHQVIQVPHIEDARADFAPHYRSRKTVIQAQAEVTAEMGKLGGGVIAFDEGYFGTGEQKRYGYILRFVYGGAEGVIRVAGLPMKGRKTDAKIRQVRLQALLNVRDWLKAAVTSQVFSPGSEPLIGHLLVPGTDKTVADHIAEQGKLPRINPPPERTLGSGVIEGEFSET
jgi:hypothetical protein